MCVRRSCDLDIMQDLPPTMNVFSPLSYMDLLSVPPYSARNLFSFSSLPSLERCVSRSLSLLSAPAAARALILLALATLAVACAHSLTACAPSGPPAVRLLPPRAACHPRFSRPTAFFASRCTLLRFRSPPPLSYLTRLSSRLLRSHSCCRALLYSSCSFLLLFCLSSVSFDLSSPLATGALSAVLT